MSGSAIADRTFTYDNLGRVKTGVFVTGGPAFSNTWDALGRLISETQNPIGTSSYAYDAAGRRTHITWPDAFYASYDYDLYSAPTAIRENGATSGAGVLATYAYDNLGRRTGVTRGNGVATSYGYDGGSRLISLTQNLSGTSSDLTLVYAYNPAGQIVTRTASNLAYVHTPPAGSTVYVNNGRNQVTSAGGSSVTYDGRQNITGTSSGSYGYDGLNQLTSATVGGVVFGASYDTLGRLQQYADGATTRLLYDGVQAVGEYDSSNALIRRYIPGLGMDETVAAYDATGVGSRSWLLADERGSVIALTNGSGAAASINTYDDYGVPGAGNVGRFQYTGQMWLSSAGLYHYKARAYAPDLGRFMQPDPIGYAGGANLYAYVGADPVNLIDPMGLRWQIVCLGTPVNEDGSVAGSWANMPNCTRTLVSGWEGPMGFFFFESQHGGIWRNMPGGEWAGGGPSEELQQAQQNFEVIYRRPALERNAWMVDYAMAPWMLVEAPFMVGAKISSAIGTRAAAAIGRTCKCFVEGTEIQTPDGARPIEELTVGDLVLARDEETGETAYKPIRALIRNDEREIWEVTVETTDAGGTVQRETIGTTDEHPWRLASGEWAETDDLRPGAELVTSDGDRVVVLSALKTDRIEPTYNFEVGDFHTYFVGESGVWVHNACPPWRFTFHGLQRAIGDGAGRAGVKAAAYRDALTNPVSTRSGIDALGRPFMIFRGKSARVVVNPSTGEIISMNPLGRAGVR